MRLLTRSDFDGICCAVLLKEVGVMDQMYYAHPKDLQDGKVKVTSYDILANVPYVAGCGMWFDHHSSEDERVLKNGTFKGSSEAAPSAARVIYNYYSEDEDLGRFDEMLQYVDKVDSADLTEDEILNPSGWVLLGFICDPRSGLGYHQEYRISNIQLMQELVDYLRTMGIDEILELPDVQERIDKYLDNNEKFKLFLKSSSRVQGNIVITDTRKAENIPAGNRFLVYSLFPHANIDIRIIKGKGGATTVFSVGHSIINRTAKVDVGSLMLKYGGGGHKQVGTCQVPKAKSDEVLKGIIKAINAA